MASSQYTPEGTSGPFHGRAMGRGVQARILGMIHEALLVPCLEAERWEVHAGKPPDDFGGVIRPVVYVGDKRLTFDYVLRRDGRTYVTEAKAWPVFHGRESKTAEPEYLRSALASFLSVDVRRDPCFIGGRSVPRDPIPLDGKVLLWWRVLEDEVRYWQEQGVLLLAIEDLLRRGHRQPRFVEYVEQYQDRGSRTLPAPQGGMVVR